MGISKVWIRLSVPIGVLMAMASAAGTFDESVYAEETVSWAAQGVGQDIVNLFVVFPLLLISGYYVSRGSVRALLVWLGMLIYVVYSYLLYAFFVHFNSWFLVYVAILGLSFYTLLGSTISMKLDELSRVFARNTKGKAASIFLMTFGVLFSVLWLADIVGSLAAGEAPQSVAEIGLPVNPVHVLDLAFLLPGMMITSVLLWKRKFLGYLFAVPLLIFAAVMGIAIISMSYVMSAEGVSAPIPFVVIIGAVVLASLYLSCRFLLETHQVEVQPAGSGAE
jgi:hypothetical protein